MVDTSTVIVGKVHICRYCAGIWYCSITCNSVSVYPGYDRDIGTQLLTTKCLIGVTFM